MGNYELEWFPEGGSLPSTRRPTLSVITRSSLLRLGPRGVYLKPADGAPIALYVTSHPLTAS